MGLAVILTAVIASQASKGISALVIVFGILTPFFGNLGCVTSILIGLFFSHNPWAGLFLFGEYFASPWLIPKIQTLNLPIIHGTSLLGFMPFLLSSIFSLPLTKVKEMDWACIGRWLLVSSMAYGMIFLGGAYGTIAIDVFTSPWFRCLVNLVVAVSSVFVLGTSTSDVYIKSTRGYSTEFIKLFVCCCLAILSAVLFSNQSKTQQRVFFDEAHGQWETVLSSFEPEDYGRGAYYTYSQLPSKIQAWGLQPSVLNTESIPTEKGVFFLKTPTQRASPIFIEKLEQWVRNGGSIVIVADHTDLYDSTQNLNEILKPFGYSLRLDACFDRTGMPNKGGDKWGDAILGHILSGTSHQWLTGTSFRNVPWNAISLADYGPSFSEEGDYSKPNRFSSFTPSWEKDFSRFSGIIYSTFGLGSVIVVLDSTPWSNFSIFEQSYQRMLLGLISIADEQGFVYFSTIFGLLLCLISTWGQYKNIQMKLNVLCLVLFSTSVALTLNLNLLTKIDATLNNQASPIVITGKTAHTVFLNEQLLPGANNFTRIVASLGKFELSPIHLTCKFNCLYINKDALYLDPSSLQLPRAEDILEELRKGNSLAFFFSSNRSTDEDILEWLKQLSLHLHAYSLPAIQVRAKSHQLSFLRNRDLILTREKTILVAEDDTSQLFSVTDSPLGQKFRLRPASIPYDRGELLISFDAEAIGDLNIGDVWEGAEPSAFGVRAEQWLSGFFNKSQFSKIEKIKVQTADTSKSNMLNQYALWENGKKIASGTLKKLSKIQSTVSLENLRNEAFEFISNNCPNNEKVTVCKRHLISSDLTEWQVRWIQSDDKNIQMIELIHNKSFSGIGNNISVIFAQ